LKRLIIYDLDGTLADTGADIIQAAGIMLEKMGLPRLSDREILNYVGRGVRALVADCLGADQTERIEEGMRIYRTTYAEHMLDNTALYPGVPKVLEHFKERRQMVLTNKPNPYSAEILKGLGVADYFYRIVAGAEEFPKKPDPAGLKAVMVGEGAGPAETLYIGDSPVDVETARGAGLTDVIVVDHGYGVAADFESWPPDHFVPSWGDLLALVRRQGW